MPPSTVSATWLNATEGVRGVSAIVGDLARVRSAFQKPTLALLARRKWAPLILAVFTSQFSRDRPRIPAEQFHAQVETLLDELRLAGEEVPDGTARDLCRGWVDGQWLSLSATEDDVEEYGITSHAQEALGVIDRLDNDRLEFGESRIKTILDTARRVATEANPDREERLRRLDEEIGRLTVERDRIAAGGDIQAATVEQMLDRYNNLNALLAALPGDFLRVSEAVKRIHRDIVAELRADQRRSGEVLDDYLRQADRLMQESQEGRAFTGAVDLLRDEVLMDDLREDLDAILAHEFAERLTPAQRIELRRTVYGIHRGMDTVLAQRRRLSATLRTHMARHDPLRDRELDEALRAADTEMLRWMDTAGPRARVPVDLGLAQVEIGHLRARLYDPENDAPPPPLETHTGRQDTVDFDDVRKQGGPTLAALRAAIEEALGEYESVTAAEVFDALPDDLRRPVEILGLLHLSVIEAGADPDPEDTAVFEAIRPGGDRRSFRAPNLLLTGVPSAGPDIPAAAADEESPR